MTFVSEPYVMQIVPSNYSFKEYCKVLVNEQYAYYTTFTTVYHITLQNKVHKTSSFLHSFA